MNAQQINERVTARIIAALEAGTVPWRQPWTGGGLHIGSSGKPYRGINQVLLNLVAGSQGYESRHWITFKQAQEQSFQQWRKQEARPDTDEARAEYKKAGAYYGVKKDQRSALVVFFKALEVKETAEERKKRQQNGQKSKPKKIPMLRYFRVFNYDQTGLDRPDVSQPEREHTPIEAAAAILEGSGARIDHGGDRAFFSPAEDRIQLPRPERFTSDESYYHTGFHELTHWTGHESRLNRIESASFGTEPYAREELTAELGAAILAGQTGISTERTEQQEAAYIKSWLRALQDDRSLVIKAGTKAQQAVDYLNGTRYTD